MAAPGALYLQRAADIKQQHLQAGWVRAIGVGIQVVQVVLVSEKCGILQCQCN